MLEFHEIIHHFLCEGVFLTVHSRDCSLWISEFYSSLGGGFGYARFFFFLVSKLALQACIHELEFETE